MRIQDGLRGRLQLKQRMHMKKFFSLALLAMAGSAFAQNYKIPDFNFELTDISSKNLTQGELFEGMDRTLIKRGASICSNRAHVWAYDFKRNNDLDTGKIFLYYTAKTGNLGDIVWWYHVAPVVADKGVPVVMDAGFSNVYGPMSPKSWLERFTKSTNCKEMKASETDLIERIFKARTFPETTSYGTYDCYYKIVPGTLWTPSHMAKAILGRDATGTPIQFSRNEINVNEVYTACVEAVTTGFGRFLGSGKKRCAKYLGLLPQETVAE